MNTLESTNFLAWLGWVLWLAVAITGDALVSTLGQFHNDRLTYRNWAGSLALTHSLFPAVSFVVFMTIASFSEVASLFVELAGVILISLVIYEMLTDAFETEPVFSLSGWIEKKTPLSQHLAKHTMKVLAVSWDALSLGPLLVLQAEKQQWNVTMTIVTFLIFAVVVGGLLVATLFLCQQLRETHFSGVEQMTRLNFYGSFFEISVVSSFAVTLLLGMFNIASGVLTSLLITLVIFATVFAANRTLLWTSARNKAEESVTE